VAGRDDDELGDVLVLDGHIRHPDVVAELVLGGESMEKRSRSWLPDRNRDRSSLSRSALISIAHQGAERRRRAARFDLLEYRLAGLLVTTNLGCTTTSAGSSCRACR
jgi:hypothetical protein